MHPDKGAVTIFSAEMTSVNGTLLLEAAQRFVVPIRLDVCVEQDP